MGSFAKKVKKHIGKRIDGIVHAKEIKARKDAKALIHMDFQTSQMAALDAERIWNIIWDNYSIYCLWTLKFVFNLSRPQVERFLIEMGKIGGCINADIIDYNDIVAECIQEMENNGCKWPEYKPEYSKATFPRQKYITQLMEERHYTHKQAMLGAKKMEIREIVYSRAEILSLMALHDALGFSKKRLERFCNSCRQLRNGSKETFYKLIMDLKKKRLEIKGINYDTIMEEWSA